MSLLSTASESKQRLESTFLSEVRATLQLAVPLGGIQLLEAAVGFVGTVIRTYAKLSINH